MREQTLEKTIWVTVVTWRMGAWFALTAGFLVALCDMTIVGTVSFLLDQRHGQRGDRFGEQYLNDR